MNSFSQVFMKSFLPSKAMVIGILKQKIFPDWPDLGDHISVTCHNTSNIKAIRITTEE